MKDYKLILCHTPFSWKRPGSIINLLIRLITGSKFDHDLVVFKQPTFKKYFAVEALGSGIVMKYLPVYLKSSKERHRKHFEVQFEPGHKVDSGLLYNSLGTKYEFSIYWRLLGFCTARRIFGKESKITKFFSMEMSHSKFFCFELAGDIFNLKRSHLLTGWDFEKGHQLKPIELSTLIKKKCTK